MKRESAFWILSAIGACAIFSSTMSKNPVLPLFAHSLGAAEQYIGVISAASTIPGILISTPAGMLSDIYGRKRMLRTALFIFASAPFLYLFVHELWQLALIRFYHGFATAIFGPVAAAAVAERYVEDRGARIGLFSSFTMAGRMVAPATGGFLLAFGSFSSVYVACAAGGVIAFVLSFKISYQENVVEKPRVRENLKTVLKNRKIMTTNIVEACQYFAFGGLETFLPLYAASVGVDVSGIGVIFTIQLAVTMLTKPTMGKLSDSMGRRPMIFSGLLLGGCSLLVIPYFTHFLWLGVAAAGFGLGLASVTASTSAFVSDLCGGSYGSALGVLSTIMDVGHASGPVVTGVVILLSGYRAAFTLLAVLSMAAGFIFIGVVKDTFCEGER